MLMLRREPSRVVLGESDPLARALIQDALEDEGYAVVTVDDGFCLLETVLDAWESSAEPIDLVVTEPFLGCYQALEVLEELRSLGWDHPFLVIDWSADRRLRRRVRAAGGATLVVDGGLDADILAAKIEGLLDAQELLVGPLAPI